MQSRAGRSAGADDAVARNRVGSPKHRRARPNSPQARDAARPPPLAPLGRRERAQLSRGRKEIDGRHRSARHDPDPRASRAVRISCSAPSSDGLTFVLVITGKGRRSAPNPNAACCAARCRNGWACRNSALVVGFEEAAYRPWRRGRALRAGAAKVTR